MIDVCDEVFGRPESEGSMADGLNLVVHSLDCSVRKPDLSPGEDSIEMAPQHTREFLERLQLRAHRRSHPFGQVSLGAPRLFVVPEQLEDFLQIPGPHQRRVPAHQRREPVFLVVIEIPGILQQQPAGSFEARSFFSPYSANRRSRSTIFGNPTRQALQLALKNPEKRL